jgi:hypothetical protein
MNLSACAEAERPAPARSVDAAIAYYQATAEITISLMIFRSKQTWNSTYKFSQKSETACLAAGMVYLSS